MKTCNACGFEEEYVPEGMLSCEKCKEAFYCSIECLKWDWKSGGHAKDCSQAFKVEEEADLPQKRKAPALQSFLEKDDSIRLDGDDDLLDPNLNAGLVSIMEESSSQGNDDSTANTNSPKRARGKVHLLSPQQPSSQEISEDDLFDEKDDESSSSESTTEEEEPFFGEATNSNVNGSAKGKQASPKEGAQALKSFQAVASQDATSKNLKAFHKAYEPKDTASIASSSSRRASIATSTPIAAADRTSSAPSKSKASRRASLQSVATTESSSTAALKESINKALRDFETLYGPEAARQAFDQLTATDEEQEKDSTVGDTSAPSASATSQAVSLAERRALRLQERRGTASSDDSSWAVPLGTSVSSMSHFSEYERALMDETNTATSGGVNYSENTTPDLTKTEDNTPRYLKYRTSLASAPQTVQKKGDPDGSMARASSKAATPNVGASSSYMQYRNKLATPQTSVSSINALAPEEQNTVAAVASSSEIDQDDKTASSTVAATSGNHGSTSSRGEQSDNVPKYLRYRNSLSSPPSERMDVDKKTDSAHKAEATTNQKGGKVGGGAAVVGTEETNVGFANHRKSVSEAEQSIPRGLSVDDKKKKENNRGMVTAGVALVGGGAAVTAAALSRKDDATSSSAGPISATIPGSERTPRYLKYRTELASSSSTKTMLDNGLAKKGDPTGVSTAGSDPAPFTGNAQNPETMPKYLKYRTSLSSSAIENPGERKNSAPPESAPPTGAVNDTSSAFDLTKSQSRSCVPRYLQYRNSLASSSKSRLDENSSASTMDNKIRENGHNKEKAAVGAGAVFGLAVGLSNDSQGVDAEKSISTGPLNVQEHQDRVVNAWLGTASLGKERSASDIDSQPSGDHLEANLNAYLQKGVAGRSSSPLDATTDDDVHQDLLQDTKSMQRKTIELARLNVGSMKYVGDNTSEIDKEYANERENHRTLIEKAKASVRQVQGTVTEDNPIKPPVAGYQSRSTEMAEEASVSSVQNSRSSSVEVKSCLPSKSAKYFSTTEDLETGRSRADEESVAKEVPLSMRAKKNRRRLKMAAILCVLIAIPVTIGAIMGLNNGDSERDSPQPPSVIPSPSPTTSQVEQPTGEAVVFPTATGNTETPVPTVSQTSLPTSSLSFAPTIFLEDEDLFNLIRQKSDSTAILTPGTPSNLAYAWLAMRTGVGALSESRIFQLYALAVVFYSTGGPSSWTQKTGWLEADDECTWFSRSNRETCDSNGNYLSLDLSVNGLTGSIPKDIGLLSTLVRLDIAGVDNFPGLIGPIPTEIGNLVSLETLNLESNSLTGQLPREISSLKNVKSLSVASNSISGLLPSTIGDLSSIEQIDLSSNSFTGVIPEEMGSLSLLARLSVQNNRFIGELPTSIGLMTSLVSLLAGNNNLTSIPAEIGGLSSIETLDLGNNQLRGSLVSEIGVLSSLRQLSLGSNQLSAELPGELGGLVNLQDVDLSENMFTGFIPSSLGSLSGLFTLQLQSNRFNGTIPSEFGGLTKIKIIRLEGNDLTGVVPSEVCSTFVQDLPAFSLDCGESAASCPVYGCCTYCCTGGEDCQCLYEGPLEFLCRPLDV